MNMRINRVGGRKGGGREGEEEKEEGVYERERKKKGRRACMYRALSLASQSDRTLDCYRHAAAPHSVPRNPSLDPDKFRNPSLDPILRTAVAEAAIFTHLPHYRSPSHPSSRCLSIPPRLRLLPRYASRF